MNIKPNVPTLSLSDRIAVHLVDFPLNKKCVNGEPSDQLLNDVLYNLQLCYPGAYSDYVPLLPIIV